MAVIVFIVLFALMWLVLIVPRQRELRRHQALMARLAVDDEVMLGAGIYGTIRWIDGERVGVEVASGVELTVARRAVAAKVETEQQPPGAPEEPGPADAGPQAVTPTADDSIGTDSPAGDSGEAEPPGGDPTATDSAAADPGRAPEPHDVAGK